MKAPSTQPLFLRIPRYLVVIVLLLSGTLAFSQITEKYTDQNKGETTFSEGGLTFSSTSNLAVDYLTDWGLDDHYFISNFDNVVIGGGTVGSFTNSSNDFHIHSLYLIPLNSSKSIERYNDILIKGKLNGAIQFTHTVPLIHEMVVWLLVVPVKLMLLV